MPSFASKTPNNNLAVVDFPEPFGPIRVTIYPLSTVKETPRTNQRDSRLIPTFSSSTNVPSSIKIVSKHIKTKDISLFYKIAYVIKLHKLRNIIT